nr:uncharacterized protein LOC117978500 isoform X2 [Pan paniscus]
MAKRRRREKRESPPEPAAANTPLRPGAEEEAEKEEKEEAAAGGGRGRPFRVPPEPAAQDEEAGAARDSQRHFWNIFGKNCRIQVIPPSSGRLLEIILEAFWQELNLFLL